MSERRACFICSSSEWCNHREPAVEAAELYVYIYRKRQAMHATAAPPRKPAGKANGPPATITKEAQS